MKKSRAVVFLFILVIAILCSCSDFTANTSGRMHVLAIGLNYKGTGASELMGTINDTTEFCGAMDGILNEKSIPRKIVCMLQEGDSDDPRTHGGPVVLSAAPRRESLPTEARNRWERPVSTVPMPLPYLTT